MVPEWLLWPLIALATVAAVIASQALISGAFSLTMQSVQMGYTPFINIRHISHEEHGQIYIPQINTLLAVGCIALVLIFRSSDALASAYGIAVTLTMIATTVLLYFAVRRFGSGALCALLCCVCRSSVSNSRSSRRIAPKSRRVAGCLWRSAELPS